MKYTKEDLFKKMLEVTGSMKKAGKNFLDNLDKEVLNEDGTVFNSDEEKIDEKLNNNNKELIVLDNYHVMVMLSVGFSVPVYDRNEEYKFSIMSYDPYDNTYIVYNDKKSANQGFLTFDNNYITKVPVDDNSNGEYIKHKHYIMAMNTRA